MQQTSELYKELLSQPHRAETRLVVGSGDVYGESLLSSVTTELRIFAEDMPAVGACVVGEISIRMLNPSSSIPEQARLVPYIRLTNGEQFSEWIQKGVFYVDTRELDRSYEGLEWLILHGYDDLIRTEEDYPDSKLDWPASDIAVVREIAAHIGVAVDERTIEIMNRDYKVAYPGTAYSQREVLGFIAAAYAGCFVMSDLGALRLIQLNSIPPETRYLIVSKQDARFITFGGDRILV